MTTHQDPTPVVLAHLTDSQGYASCDGTLVPVNPYLLDRSVPVQQCPACAMLATGEWVRRSALDEAHDAGYDKGYADAMADEGR